jgi:hypothetical protein
MGFSNRVVDTATIALAAEKLAPLHQAKMFGGHMAGDFTCFSQFADRITTSEQHLDHPQSMGMGECFEALGSLFQFSQFQKWERIFGGGHNGVPYLILKYIGTLRHSLEVIFRIWVEIG